MGYLERDEDSKLFSLSRKLLSMGYHVLQHTSLVEAAMPLMRELRGRVRETITLCGIEEASGIVLEHVPSPHSFRLTVETGAHFHLHSSAPGKAILAFLPEDDRMDLTGRISFERFTTRTIGSPKELERALTEVRRVGYATDEGEEFEGIRCVSAPILDKKSYPVAAVVVTGPSSRFKNPMLEAYGMMTGETALAISHKLGHPA